MKIIYYMPVFLKMQAQQSSNKKLLDFCELFKIVSPNASLIDRSNALETPFDTKILYEIPGKPTIDINLKYDDICISRAEKILKENRNIIIFYSGGLDSTVVVLSFWLAIQNGIGNYDQITIAASQHSIIENPLFWNKIILPNFKLASVDFVLKNINISNRYVMGENADQLFGSDIILKNFDFFNQNITDDNIGKFLQKQEINKTSEDYIFRALHTLRNNCPIHLEKMSDLIWWLNYSCKWQSVALRALCFTNFLDVISTQEELKFFDTFFNTQDFQIISLYGNLPKWGEVPTPYNYKKASRIFIDNHIDLKDYTKTKIKVPSLYRVLSTNEYKYNALGIENGKISRVQNIEMNKL